MNPGNRNRNAVFRFVAAQILATFTAVTPAVAASSSPDPGTVRGVLLHEAYYYFFLSDYLESGTRLKLIGSAGPDGSNPAIQNDVQALLGSLYFAWRMDRTARRAFSELISEQPEGYDRDDLLYRLERLEYGRKLYGGATETFGLISPDSKIPEADRARYMAGMSFQALGSLDRSVEILESVSPASPYHPFSRYAIAQAETGLENYPDAIRELKTLGGAKTGKDPVRTAFRDKSLLTLGLLYVDRGNFDAAAQTLSAIPGTSPFRPEALYGMGWAKFNSGKFQEALLLFEELIRTAPDHPYAVEAMTIRANCYARLKANRAALTSYGKAVDTYAEKIRAYREARSWVGDPGRLEKWLVSPEENPAHVLDPLLGDEALLLRIGQYRELIGFEDYFNRKLQDMDVFDVMLRHRESVYRDHLPDVEKFLKGQSVEVINEKGEALRKDFVESVQAESGVLGLLMKSEEDSLAKIEASRKEVERLKEKIGKVSSASPDELQALSDRISAIERWLSIYKGEILWASITELPGRSDDADNQIAGLAEDIENLKIRKEHLIRSIDLMRDKLAAFGKAIPRLAEQLRQERDRTVALRNNLLSPIQALFIRTIDGRLGYYNQLASYARFGQIQVMDTEKQ